MPKLIALLCTLLTFLFVACTSVHAWNKAGHMTSAAIAYADPKERNPDAPAKAVQLLKEHPQFDSLRAHKLNQIPAEERNLHLFMLAARWSDDIRGDEDYDHHDWHFVDIPYRPGQSDIALPQVESILTAFAEELGTAKSKSATGDEVMTNHGISVESYQKLLMKFAGAGSIFKDEMEQRLSASWDVKVRSGKIQPASSHSV